MPSRTHRVSRPQRIRLRSLALDRPLAIQCSNAKLILEAAHESAAALLKAYNLARQSRGGRGNEAPRGMTTDEEQDLLRAMLVMAAAGLDSMVKQLVRDVLPLVLREDERARSGLERHIVSRIRPGDGDFLGRVLSAIDHAAAVIEDYVTALTSSSLQSAAELARAASAFGLEPREVGIDFEELRRIFDARNKIIHELDMNLSADRRIRNVRGSAAMVRDTNMLLEIGERILCAVSPKADVRK